MPPLSTRSGSTRRQSSFLASPPVEDLARNPVTASHDESTLAQSRSYELVVVEDGRRMDNGATRLARGNKMKSTTGENSVTRVEPVGKDGVRTRRCCAKGRCWRVCMGARGGNMQNGKKHYALVTGKTQPRGMATDSGNRNQKMAGYMLICYFPSVIRSKERTFTTLKGITYSHMWCERLAHLSLRFTLRRCLEWE